MKKLDLTNRPKQSQEIVWRFKDNKGWRTGWVRELMGGYQIARITEGEHQSSGGEIVAIEDIDWYYR
jgi:hypothetical protein